MDCLYFIGHYRRKYDKRVFVPRRGMLQQLFWVLCIVDEAHGAHLGFAPEFAVNSARLGADLVINSVHKTLPAMTQTALLHVNGELVDRQRLRRYLKIYQTSSPSYVLMSSIEEAVETAMSGNAFKEFAGRWEKLLTELSELQRLKIFPKWAEECRKKHQDIGKLIISTRETELSGPQLYDMLLEEHHLQPEMVCESYVLCMFTIGDTEEGYDRLVKALLAIDVQIQRTQRHRMPESVKTDMPTCEAPCSQHGNSLHSKRRLPALSRMQYKIQK